MITLAVRLASAQIGSERGRDHKKGYMDHDSTEPILPVMPELATRNAASVIDSHSTSAKLAVDLPIPGSGSKIASLVNKFGKPHTSDDTPLRTQIKLPGNQNSVDIRDLVEQLENQTKETPQSNILPTNPKTGRT